MRYAAIIPNDMVNGEDVCVSFWVQGCPHMCKGCHNKDMWDFKGGIEKSDNEVINEIDAALRANGIHRNLSILGGEPLCKENIRDTALVILYVKINHPDSKIFLWTGYELDEIPCSFPYNIVRDYVDVIIDGPYIEALRDTSLKLRGSSNQRILYKNVDF